MNKRNFSDLENQITFIVDKAFKAVESVDFKEIRDKGDYAFNKAKTKASEIYNTARNKKEMKKYISKKPYGKIKGYAYIVVGILGIVISSFLLLGFSVFSIMLSNFITVGNYIGVGILIGFLACSAIFLGRGISLRGRVRRFKKYISLMNNKTFILIEDLAKLSGLKEKFIIKDLQKMNELGMFLEGRIDEEKTCFMLSDTMYQDYINSRKKQRFDMNGEKVKKDTKVNKEKSLVDTGKEYIGQIKSINNELSRGHLTDEIERLINITNQIINYVEKNPKKEKEIHKLVTYYLPMIMKLINSYYELDRQVIQSDNIKNAKVEIEHSIDTINIAFEKLLDELFEEAAMDISSDISVLKTLFKQEGLTEKDFKNKGGV